VDHLDAEVARQLAPALAGGRLDRAQAGVLGEVDQRLLDEVRDQAGLAPWAITAVGRPVLGLSASMVSRSA
jgi:hypothetical protein